MNNQQIELRIVEEQIEKLKQELNTLEIKREKIISELLGRETNELEYHKAVKEIKNY